MEAPSHFWNTSIFGGLFSLPLYIVVAYLSSGTGQSLTGDTSLYEYIFGSQVANVAACFMAAILFLIRPIAATNFILSINQKITFIAFEIMGRLFLPSLT